MLRAIASICGWLKRQSRGVGRRSRVVWSGLEPAGQHDGYDVREEAPIIQSAEPEN